MKIDHRVRLLRNKLHLTQEEFARRIGVSFKTINQWENKKSRPSKLALQRLETVEQEADASN
jgi:DNA-binding transcriptional regulator YiaG